MKKLLALTFLCAASAAAQQGPAELINSAQEQAAEESAAGRAQAMDPQTMEAVHRTLAPPSLAESNPSADVPVGAIQIAVVDGADQPIAGAPIRLGIMRQGGQRENRTAETDAAGQFRFEGLEVSEAISYRVNVSREGATYSSTPFRLEAAAGQIVRIRAPRTTTNTRGLLQTLGQMMIEYVDGRARISQRAEIVNMDAATILPPEGGLQFDLPAGFTNFENEQGMGDQRVVKNDRGFAIEGSFPPGQITIDWMFDLPVSDDSLAFDMPMPLRTYRYRVISDSAEGMSLAVESFEETFPHSAGDRDFLVAQTERNPTDANLDRLSVRVHGIPGVGPARWLAVAFALLFVVVGVWFAGRKPAKAEALNLSSERERVLQKAKELWAERQRGEVGPLYYAEQRQALADEVALLLKAEREG